MAAYEVIGTKFYVAGSSRKRRWYVFELAAEVGDGAVAGPFKTKAAAVNWAILNEVIPVD